MSDLLPHSTTPFKPPSDREMLPSERREFVRTHRTCVFGYSRRNDGPAMSVVYYIPTTDDELLISTMRDRAKAKAVANHGKVSLCVLDERWPLSFLQVYCGATLETDSELVVDVMAAVAERMSGEPLPEAARPPLPRWPRRKAGWSSGASRTQRSPRHRGTFIAATRKSS